MNGPNDVPTQTCFDKNVLKFKSDNTSLNIDEYTVSTKQSDRPDGATTYTDQKFQ